PLGPIRPTMRPGCTFRSTPRSACVSPYVFVRPRASIIAVIFIACGSACRERLGGRGRFRTAFICFFGREAEPRDRRVNLRPLGLEEVDTLVFHERLPRSFVD